MGWISGEQLERDHRGLRNVCAADGHEGTERTPLALTDEGIRVHAFHFSEPDAVFQPQQDADEDVA